MFKLTAPKVISRSAALSYLAVLLLFFLSASLPAAPVSAQLARLFAQQWLASADKPLKADFSAHSISEVSAIENAAGLLIGYHVALQPEGYVIISADDRIQPLVSFSARGTYDDRDANPLRGLLLADLQARLAAVEELAPEAPPTPPADVVLLTEIRDLLKKNA